MRVTVSYDLAHPIDDTTPLDWVVVGEVAAFVGFVAVAMVIAAINRKSFLLRVWGWWGWLWLMSIGSVVQVVSVFISNGHIEALRDVGTFHCPLFDFGGIFFGFGLWFCFCIASILTNIGHRFQVTMEGVGFQSNGFDDEDSMFIGQEEAGNSGIVGPVRFARNKDIIFTRQVTEACDNMDQRGRVADQEALNRIESFIEASADAFHRRHDVLEQQDLFQLFSRRFLPRRAYVDGHRAPLFLGIRRRLIVLRIRLNRIGRRIRRRVYPYWASTSRVKIAAFLRVTALALILAPIAIGCAMSEIPGATGVSSDTNTCKAALWIKLYFIAILFMQLGLLAIVYKVAAAKRFLYAHDMRLYRSVIFMGVFVLASMVVINLLGVELYYWGRFLYINILMAFYIGIFCVVLSKASLDTLELLLRGTCHGKGSREMALFESLHKSSIPDTFAMLEKREELMGEFLRYVERSKRISLPSDWCVSDWDTPLDAESIASEIVTDQNRRLEGRHVLVPHRMVRLWRRLCARRVLIRESHDADDFARRLGIIHAHIINQDLPKPAAYWTIVDDDDDDDDDVGVVDIGGDADDGGRQRCMLVVNDASYHDDPASVAHGDDVRQRAGMVSPTLRDAPVPFSSIPCTIAFINRLHDRVVDDVSQNGDAQDSIDLFKPVEDVIRILLDRYYFPLFLSSPVTMRDLRHNINVNQSILQSIGIYQQERRRRPVPVVQGNDGGVFHIDDDDDDDDGGV